MRRLRLLPLLGLLLLVVPARAFGQGFTLNRYEPAIAGQSTFMVDRPWYSAERLFAAGLTLNWGHNPLVAGPVGSNEITNHLVNNQLIGSLDLAVSAWDRLTFSFSIPLTLHEWGHPAAGIGPISGAQVGDPRLGLNVRLWKHADSDPFSLHFTGMLWVPVGSESDHTGDRLARGLLRLVAAGRFKQLRYTFNLGFLLRGSATLPSNGTITTASGRIPVGHELQLAAEVAWVGARGKLSIGPEIGVSTLLPGGEAFHRDATSIEIAVLSINYRIANQLLLGVAYDVGALRELGTPDHRVVLHIAYAPTRQPHPRAAYVEPECPPAPLLPPPTHDRDHDGIVDAVDVCPDVSAWNPTPDPRPARKGCPAGDSDGDGVLDPQDLCPSVPAGAKPDPNRPGCPLPDRDNDGISDDADACPDKPGVASDNPKQNGCPKLVEVKGDKIEILEPVFFATNKDVILPQSEGVLTAVSDVMAANREIKRVAVEGHTDNVGSAKRNLDLSRRRAASVVRWLVTHGTERWRLESHGYGSTHPLRDEDTDEARAANRRVEFKIVDRDTAPLPSSP